MNLEVLTSHLVAVHAYIGVLEIALAAASKRDPQGLALHFYKNGEPNEDQQGLQAYMTRTACYKHVTRYGFKYDVNRNNFCSIAFQTQILSINHIWNC